MSPRLSLLATLALVVPACGGEDLAPDASSPDAEPLPDAAPIVPDAAIEPDAEPPAPVCDGEPGEGATYTYVIDSINVPKDSDKAEAYGLDLDGDGTTDNQLGNILAALVQAGGGLLDSQAEITTSVDDGSTLLLASLSPCSPTSQAFATFAGANPNPPACDGPSDTTCRHHLAGTGAFDLAVDSPVDRVTPGVLAGDAFVGGPGELVFQLALAGTAPVQFDLVHAHVRLNDVTATSLGASVIAGGIPEAQIDERLIPAMHASITTVIAADCTGTGEQCGCAPDSTGLTMLGIFDENEDCIVSLPELQDNSLIVTLFRPDLDTDGDDVMDALSMGVGITAVAATFTVPEAP